MDDEPIPKSLQDMERSKWRFSRRLYKKPIYFVEGPDGTREFRMYFSMQPEIYLPAKHYDDFLALILSWKERATTPQLLLPGLTINGMGELEEDSPARKVIVLQRNFKDVGVLFLDQSPKQFSCGVDIADPAKLRRYNAAWWGDYLSNRLQVLKLKNQVSQLEERRYTLYKRIAKEAAI